VTVEEAKRRAQAMFIDELGNRKQIIEAIFKGCSGESQAKCTPKPVLS
jgi:hypothetical protein